MVQTTDSAKTKLKKAEESYISRADNTLDDVQTKVLQVRADIARKLGGHIQGFDGSKSVPTFTVNLQLCDLVKQLKDEGVAIGRDGVRRHLKKIAEDTGVQYNLGDYMTKLYMIR